jgi:hypothetical protein
LATSKIKAATIGEVKAQKVRPFGASHMTRLSNVNNKLLCTIGRDSVAMDAYTKWMISQF